MLASIKVIAVLLTCVILSFVTAKIAEYFVQIRFRYVLLFRF